MAERAVSADYRECCLDLEQRWLKLALSYEYSDQINDFVARLVCKHDERSFIASNSTHYADNHAVRLRL